MKNNIDITISSTPSRVKNLSRTSYDMHQEINAKVIGVLKYNNKIRKDLLGRNIGIYNLVNTEEGIGNISNFYSNLSNKPSSFGKDGLLGFTHINESDYQKEINKKYDIGEFIQYYKTGSLSDSTYFKWNGLYDDYTKYIDEVYGFKFTTLNLLSSLFKGEVLQKDSNFSSTEEYTLTIQSVLYDILQYDNIKYAMEKTMIGTITPNPLASLAGSVVTNINNFSGKDTSLGLITNHLYAHTLKNSAQFNSLRRTNYITPEIYDTLGLKLSTISTIGADFRIDNETGRLSFDLGGASIDYSTNSIISINIEDISYNSFIEKQIDLNKNVFNTNNSLIRNLSRNRLKYLPFNDVDGEYGQYKQKQDSVKLLNARLNPYIGNKVYKIWNEGDSNQINDHVFTYNGQNGYGGFSNSDIKEGLLNKTNVLFQSHDENGIDTLIGRFHTTGGRDKTHNEVSLLQTAVSNFGMSHGRNLLNKKAYETKVAEKENGYSNPYCRTWTYHNQYDKLNKLIRPFKNDYFEKSNLQNKWYKYGRRKGSADRISSNSVLNDNGFVNITPNEEKNDITKCMFSIENLAWKDITSTFNKNILSKEQTGPNGGRIMWFPPYDLRFNEQVSVDWNPNEFIGRGEKIYTYKNTERSGTLSFALLVDHPSILDMWKKHGKDMTDDDKEQNLLRFFAGCDVLELDNVKVQEEVPYVEPEPDKIPITPVEPEEIEGSVIFYIYYSNNFSGYDNYSDAEEYLSTDYEVKSFPKGTTKEYKYDIRYSDQIKHLKLNNNHVDRNFLGLNTDLEFVKKSDFSSDATTTFNQIATNKESVITKNMVVTKVIIESFSSSHGYKKENKILRENRNSFAKDFIIKSLIVNSEKNIEIIDDEERNNITVSEKDIKDISGESAKRARCSKVIIKTKQSKPIETSENMTNEKISGNSENFQIVNISENETNSQTIEVNANKTKRQKRKEKRENKKKQKEFEKWSTDTQRLNTEATNMLKTINDDYTIDTGITNTKSVNRQLSMQNMGKVATSTIVKNKTELIDNEVRYEDEAQYFSLLKENDSFLYTRLIDKIKYFTPAFHSITPEGFNSRLSFLHQCTRQGFTSSVSDTPSKNSKNESIRKSAGNLAFGRPPICVLRIGDFYHTKIVINSITIDYDNTIWDMNPEGIGMQPMYAKISLNFHFLGGSDLSSPISRLQNAISFNYYANQSLYDDRSDIGIYDNRTSKIQGKPWHPNNK